MALLPEDRVPAALPVALGEERRIWLQWVQAAAQTRSGQALPADLITLLESLWLASSQGHVAVPVTAAQWAGLQQAGLTDTDPVVVVQRGWLYLPRWASAETRLAACLRARMPGLGSAPLAQADPARLAELDEDQQAFVHHALQHSLTLLTGGPGTGKTRTIVALLQAALAEMPLDDIAVVAPTGKAASRLNEGLAEQGVAVKATTVHRLLGSASHSRSLLDLPKGLNARTRFHAGQPLPHRLVVVDEASMLGLEWASVLLQACGPTTHVVLAGDRDQLASVEPGAVFAHLVDALGAIRLRTNYRQAEAPELAALVRDVREGRVPSPMALEPVMVAVRREPIINALHTLLAPALDALASIMNAAIEGQGKALQSALAHCKVLCAQRQGPFGVERLNAWAQAVVALHPAFSAMPPQKRPSLLIVRRNLERLQLANGDIGLALNHLPVPMVAFAQGETCRLIPANQLPEVEPAWALTVHQAQGSEYAHVLLVLADVDSPLNTRELLYTGLTRARRSVQVAADAAQWRAAVSRVTQRDGGLPMRLESGPPENH